MTPTISLFTSGSNSTPVKVTTDLNSVMQAKIDVAKLDKLDGKYVQDGRVGSSVRRNRIIGHLGVFKNFG